MAGLQPTLVGKQRFTSHTDVILKRAKSPPRDRTLLYISYAVEESTRTASTVCNPTYDSGTVRARTVITRWIRRYSG